MDASVIVRNLGKCFKLYRRSEYRLLEAVLPRLKLHRELWALRHVSFELAKGQSLAVIGPNGAGKSTLLRILAGASVPTEGSYTIEGRVGAVLELGLGFAPTLTGRQNIRIAALMMGLSVEEVDDRIDDIAAFSELGEYLDRPVREYSSGMRSRLGFAIASHLDVQVLLADEALSAGDHMFRLRAAERVHTLLDRGVTLIYATHSAKRARELCQRALWIEYGRVMEEGPVDAVIRAYSLRGRSVVLTGRDDGRHRARATIVAARIAGASASETLELAPLERLTCELDVYCSQPTERVDVLLTCTDQAEKTERSVLLSKQFPEGLDLPQGFHRLRVSFRAPRTPGVYDVLCRLGSVQALFGERFYETRLLPAALCVRDPEPGADSETMSARWTREPIDGTRLAEVVPSELILTDPTARSWLRSGWCFSRNRFGVVGAAEFFLFLPPEAEYLELLARRVPKAVRFRVQHPDDRTATTLQRVTHHGNEVAFRGDVPRAWTGRALLLVLELVGDGEKPIRLEPGREPVVHSIRAVRSSDVRDASCAA